MWPGLNTATSHWDTSECGQSALKTGFDKESNLNQISLKAALEAATGKQDHLSVRFVLFFSPNSIIHTSVAIIVIIYHYSCQERKIVSTDDTAASLLGGLLQLVVMEKR